MKCLRPRPTVELLYTRCHVP